MSASIYYQYYPKACNNPTILPFLNIESDWFHGNHMPKGFYDACRQYSEWNEDNECWIFADVTKLFEFAADSRVPVSMSDYITNTQYIDEWDNIPHKEDDVFIIWKR